MDKTAARAEALRIPPPKKGPGPCALPGHSHNAWLRYTSKGRWEYWCPACDEDFSLAEVRAIRAYADIPHGDERDDEERPDWDRIRRPGLVEVSRWGELLDCEAGLLEPRPVPIHFPLDLSATARRVGNAIHLLLALRSEERWEDQDEFTFTRRFCRARTGLSNDRARAGLEELKHRRVIVPVGKARRAIVYRLGDASEVVGEGEGERSDHEEALVDAFKAAFDAEEIPSDDEGAGS